MSLLYKSVLPQAQKESYGENNPYEAYGWTACNYDSAVTNDNGTCGCMNALAFNYDETATQDDGSCEIYACNDSGALNEDTESAGENDTQYNCTDPSTQGDCTMCEWYCPTPNSPVQSTDYCGDDSTET